MNRFLGPTILAAALVALTPAANAQDFARGLEFSQAGNYEAALKEWHPLAKQGDAEAQFNLGIIYDKGEGILKDAEEAVRWYRLAAEQGHANAQTILGLMYYEGDGVSQNGKEAMRWTRLAARQGHAIAQGWLGLIHAEGKDAPKDAVAAHMWYSASLANGYENAGRLRGSLETTMTPEQIAQATQKAETCLSSNYANCD